MNQLEKARKRIDEIDEQMAALYQQRMDAVEDVIAWKKENGMPILDASREQSMIERNVKRLNNPQLAGMYEKFLEFMLAQSRAYQKSLLSKDVIAYAGVEGAFSHMTSERLFEGNPKLACNSFEEVVQAVLGHEARFGVIPLENTTSGLVGEVMDLLMRYPVYIDRVSDQKIDQCLLGLPDATLKDIQWVYSKDQALNQAKEFLDSLGVEKVPYPNTAMAAQYIAKCQDKRLGAIAARENAVLYGLKVLASHIEQTNDNTTRFLVISREPSQRPADHLALMFSVSNIVGSLAKVIEIISSHGLNMDSLQSRPMKERPFEYFFYVQCTGEISREAVDALMKDLEPVTAAMKWMGNYHLEERENADPFASLLDEQKNESARLASGMQQFESE